MYCSHRLWFLSRPKSTRNDWIASVLSRPWYLEMRELTGSPGIIRGMKKLSVMAAHAVNR
jgi:hypothetical protein